MQYQTDDSHMCGIVPVEEPPYPFAVAPLAVVKGQQQHGEPARKVYHPVYVIIDDEESNSIQRYDCHQPQHLLVEVPPAASYHQYRKGSGTAPVGCCGEHASEHGNKDFDRDVQFITVPCFQENKSPHERPGDTCLIEDKVVKGIEGRLGEIAECKMAHYRQHSHASEIFLEVVSVVIPLGGKEKHDGSREPSYTVQDYLRRSFGLGVSIYAHPGHMIYRHSDNGDDLEHIAGEPEAFVSRSLSSHSIPPFCRACDIRLYYHISDRLSIERIYNSTPVYPIIPCRAYEDRYFFSDYISRRCLHPIGGQKHGTVIKKVKAIDYSPIMCYNHRKNKIGNG